MSRIKIIAVLTLVVGLSIGIYKYLTKPSNLNDTDEVQISDSKINKDGKAEKKEEGGFFSSFFKKESSATVTADGFTLPDYRKMNFDKEVIGEKKKKLQSAAEKFQKETMEKLEKISNRDDLSPEEMMNLVYQDDKGNYSPDKKFYLDEIAKPLLDDEDMAGGADMDLSKVLSKAYDLLEATDPENVKIATNALRAIPDQSRKNISKELKDFQRSIAGKSNEEMEDLYADIQNDKTENVAGLNQALGKLGSSKEQDLLKTYALSSLMINSLNK